MALSDWAVWSLVLRHLHWLGWLVACAGLLAWTWPRAVRATNASAARRRGQNALVGGLLAAAVSAWAWPALFVAQAWPEAASWPALAALGLSGWEAWFPRWPTLWTLTPEWPLAWRPEPDVPASAHALRQLRLSLGLLAAALLLVLVFLRTRHGRRAWLLAAALLLAVLAPLPRPALLLADATPATFLQPAMSFSVGSIMAGRGHYVRHCLQCHGERADGQGPEASRQAMWPSTLGPALFAQRHAGDLYWRIAARQTEAGRRMRADHPAELAPAQAWAVLDYLRALAAGQEAASGRGWQQALPAPDFALRCERNDSRRLRDLLGRPVHLLLDASASAVLADPRLVTVLLASRPVRGYPDGVDCVAESSEAVHVYALLLGQSPAAQADPPPGGQVLLDRRNWLRTHAMPGRDAGWSAADSMCGPQDGSVSSGAGVSLDALLRTMDDRPVAAPRFRNRFLQSVQ